MSQIINIIFVQSHKDMLYALDIISKHNNIFIIYVTGNKILYNYLKKINKVKKIYFFKTKKFTDPLLIPFLIRIYFHRLPKKYSKIIKNIYFFSDMFDYVTPILIRKKSNLNKIFLIETYPIIYKINNNQNFFEKFLIYYFKFFFNISLDFINIKNYKVKRYNHNKPIEKIKKYKVDNIQSNYLINFFTQSKVAIFVLNEYFFHEEEISLILQKIYFLLKKINFSVFLKKHPNNNKDTLNIKYDHRIVSNLPLEVYNFPKDTLIIGFSSASLEVNHPDVNSISLLNLEKNNPHKESDLKYIKSLSRNILIPANFNEFNYYINTTY